MIVCRCLAGALFYIIIDKTNLTSAGIFEHKLEQLKLTEMQIRNNFKFVDRRSNIAFVLKSKMILNKRFKNFVHYFKRSYIDLEFSSSICGRGGGGGAVLTLVFNNFELHSRG